MRPIIRYISKTVFFVLATFGVAILLSGCSGGSGSGGIGGGGDIPPTIHFKVEKTPARITSLGSDFSVGVVITETGGIPIELKNMKIYSRYIDMSDGDDLKSIFNYYSGDSRMIYGYDFGNPLSESDEIKGAVISDSSTKGGERVFSKLQAYEKRTVSTKVRIGTKQQISRPLGCTGFFYAYSDVEKWLENTWYKDPKMGIRYYIQFDCTDDSGENFTIKSSLDIYFDKMASIISPEAAAPTGITSEPTNTNTNPYQPN
ncbi:MAG: hypothetical protein HQM10_04395 [Candidatus Riflebacteria bacterium]|nr:hypothetical protein [Candidatus Riflebacteria bacterium]